MKNDSFIKALLISLAALLALSCSAVSIGATATPAPTYTPEAIKTATPRPTFTPRPTSTPSPTATKIPPTPTPAAKGEAVTNGKIEVTVLDMFRHDKIVPGGTYYYWAKPGYIIIDIFVKVKNLQTSSVSIKWDDVRIAEGEGSSKGNVFAGGWKAVSGKEKVAPLSFGYTEVTKGSNAQIVFDDTVYLQVIYIIAKDTEFVLFSIEDAPQIQVFK